jgi:putative transposase
VTDLHDYDARVWGLGQRRLKIVAALAAAEHTDKKSIEAAAWELGISRAYCYRLLRRYRENPSITRLMPQSRGRVAGYRLLDPAVDTVIEAAINEFYLTPERPTMAGLVQEVARRCARQSLKAPTYKAVLARVKARKMREVLKKREGAASARAQTARIAGHLVSDDPFGLVQIDHTLADVIVVAEGSRLPIGRPWLTLAIDVATRVVAGFYLSLERPSALAVALVLSHVVLPKDRYLRGRGVDVAWPMYGIPDRVHLDNAKEFHSQALARGAQRYGIEVDYRPPAQPHWGGHIERLIGTMMGAVHLLPGSTFSNTLQRGVYDSEAAAVMTMAELETWLVHQIAGVYHHSVHRAIGKAPITAWTEAMAQLSRPMRTAPDEDRFYLDFLPFRKRSVQRGGIALFNISYSDSVISTFLSSPRQQFLIRYDPRDMSQVYLRDSDGAYWPIPYSDRRLPAVTLSEINAVRRQLLDAGHKRLTQSQVFEALDRQRELVELATVRSKGARRDHDRARRGLHEAKASGANPSEKSATVKGPQGDDGPIIPFAVEEWS